MKLLEFFTLSTDKQLNSFDDLVLIVGLFTLTLYTTATEVPFNEELTARLTLVGDTTVAVYETTPEELVTIISLDEIV